MGSCLILIYSPCTNDLRRSRVGFGWNDHDGRGRLNVPDEVALFYVWTGQDFFFMI